jgi:hypothetical protein
VYFLLYNWRTGGQNKNCQRELILVGRGRRWAKGVGGWIRCKQVLCSHVCKWISENCWNYSRNGGGGMKANDGGGEFNLIHFRYCKNFCKCHHIPLHNTTMKKIHKKGD